MTRVEALKIVRLNLGRQCGSMQEAIKTLVPELAGKEPTVEKVCGTCTYWQEGTLDRGQCQAGEPHQTHSADTCDMWEQHEEIPMKEQAEKDLALTWQDIRAIDELLTLVYDPDNEEGYYTRVLEEFNKQRGEK